MKIFFITALLFSWRACMPSNYINSNALITDSISPEKTTTKIKEVIGYDNQVLELLNSRITYVKIETPDSYKHEVLVWCDNVYLQDVDMLMKECIYVIDTLMAKATKAQTRPGCDVEVGGILVPARVLNQYLQKAGGARGLYEGLYYHAIAKAPVIKVSEFDADPFLLNTPSGLVDLRNGTVRKTTPNDLLTKITKGDFNPDYYNHNSFPDDFLSLIDRQLNDDYEAYCSCFQCLSLCLLGENRYRKIFVIKGSGRTGKTTLMEIIKRCMGGYASSMASQALTMSSKSDKQLRPELVRTSRFRLVVASELSKEYTWDQPILKTLSGEDETDFRSLHSVGYPMKYNPKLWVVTNELPRFSSMEDSPFLDRLVVIRFHHPITEDQQDLNLVNRLSTSDAQARILSGLAFVLGTILKEDDFKPHNSFNIGNDCVLVEQDPIISFLDEGRNGAIEYGCPYHVYQASVLYQAFQIWMYHQGKPIYDSIRGFGLKARKYCREKMSQIESRISKGRTYVGFYYPWFMPQVGMNQSQDVATSGQGSKMKHSYPKSVYPAIAPSAMNEEFESLPCDYEVLREAVPITESMETPMKYKGHTIDELKQADERVDEAKIRLIDVQEVYEETKGHRMSDSLYDTELNELILPGDEEKAFLFAQYKYENGIDDE
jgi:P4 family phage/plasmid primase-like protien